MNWLALLIAFVLGGFLFAPLWGQLKGVTKKG